MARGSKGGKAFMQNTDELLKLAEAISSEKDRDIRHKVDKMKAAVACHDESSKLKNNRRRRGQSSGSSDKLRTAKELVVARKMRQKYEKRKARQRRERDCQEDATPNQQLSHSTGPNCKRVSFA